MKRWRQIWRHFPKRQRDKNGDFLGGLRVENRERHDYREFLRKFSVFREELKADPDTFDYGFLQLRHVTVWKYAADRTAGDKGRAPD